MTTPFLDVIPFASGHAFEPETIKAMSIAYEGVSACLNLGRTGQLNELIARNIIELATSGEWDAERLSANVLATYKPPPE